MPSSTAGADTRFSSRFRELGHVGLPEFSGIRVMMMPIVLGDLASIPESLARYRDTLEQLFALQGHDGRVGYLTIDEKRVLPARSHRRGGLHVDGVYRGRPGSWGGGGGPWAGISTGMLTVSSHVGCRAWNQEFVGTPGAEGECEHLAGQCQDEAAQDFAANMAYWADGLCVHESLPMTRAVDRQFVRLSLPSEAPWFEGYTENPLGVKPTGPILAPREFMAH